MCTSRQFHKVLVLISCCLPMAVDGGVFFAFGTLFTDFMSTFNSSRAETSIIQAVMLAVVSLSGA